jgi:type I restriction enzyme M protein
MPTPRQVLDLLSRDELLALADGHGLIVGDRRVKAHIADQLETTGPGAARMFGGFSRDRLADLCRALGLDGGVQEKERVRLREIIERVNSPVRG